MLRRAVGSAATAAGRVLQSGSGEVGLRPALGRGVLGWARWAPFTTPPTGSEAKGAGASREDVAAGGANGPEPAGEPLSSEDLQKENDSLIDQIAKQATQLAEANEKVLRVLAETENMRTRTLRQSELDRKFAVQSFAKDMLEVADNLGRAAASVPPVYAGKPDEVAAAVASGTITVDKAAVLVGQLLNGITMTDRVLLQVLKRNGLERYVSLGEPFDPNLHSALFKVPDATKPAGTVAHVTKEGYKLHDRIIRPADVGVTTAPGSE